MAQLIGDNLVVSIHYTLTNDEGETLDSSIGHEPLAYLHGAGNIIPGLEQALTGKTEGDTLNVHIEAADAYGEVVPELIQKVDISAFSGVESVEPGMRFESQTESGDVVPIEVKAVEGNEVTIDGNHPLAGVALNFAVEVVGIREASSEELAHGHAH
ncbi:MAG: peptidylprolyl isomerase [Gammaproteobacteria bacterium]|nr:MAG: peptidylprolyl isomerase [Gammaproteobacteria bacterium]